MLLSSKKFLKVVVVEFLVCLFRFGLATSRDALIKFGLGWKDWSELNIWQGHFACHCMQTVFFNLPNKVKEVDAGAKLVTCNWRNCWSDIMKKLIWYQHNKPCFHFIVTITFYCYCYYHFVSHIASFRNQIQTGSSISVSLINLSE